jgi:hypothetical protein
MPFTMKFRDRPTRVTRAAFALIVMVLPCPARAQPGVLDYGPHAVGFRSVLEPDRSRMLRARTTFDGTPVAGAPTVPMQISLWYPAQLDQVTAPLTTGDYRRLSRQPPRDVFAMVTAWQQLLGVAGRPATEGELLRALAEPRRARRDAPPLAGRHPVILGGLESPATSSVLGEYLASHGYVVITTPSLARTVTQQATAPLIAIETQARNLEFLLAFAHGVSFADDTRLGIAGINFDGMAALTFQMRNMRADAIVSVDGWEGKAGGGATLRESPYFQPVQMRVPYLVFEQDEPSVPAPLAHDRSVWDALKYSDRQWYVLREFGHVYLTTDQLTAPNLPAEAVEGYKFLYGTIREFFDAHVRKASPLGITRSRAVVKERHAAPALPPAPTGEEFEQLVMSGPITRAVEVFRRARRENPDLILVDEGTLNLYAFRFEQQKQVPETLAMRALAVDAFPSSARAAYNLGIAYANAGDVASARSALTRALTLLDADARMSAPEKERLRADIRQRLALEGDRTLFTTRRGVDAAWRIVDPIVNVGIPLVIYEPGSPGPSRCEA